MMQLRTSAAAAIAFAECHGKVVFQQIRLGRIAPRRDHENRERIVKGSSGLEIAIVFSGFQNNGIARLMAGHANVIGEPGFEFRGIHD